VPREKNKVTEEQPRGLLFHFVFNMVFASLAIGAGALFGERIPKDKLGIVFLGVALIALLLLPVTRRWERSGIAKRAAEKGPAAQNKRPAEKGPAAEKGRAAEKGPAAEKGKSDS
jgi:hypothetical protein